MDTDPLVAGVIRSLGSSRRRLSDKIYSLAVTPDSSLVIAGNYYETRCWDAVTGNTVKRLPGSRRLAISPDGQRLATVYRGVQLRSLSTYERVVEFERGKDEYTTVAYGTAGVAYGTAGSLIAAGEEDTGIVRCWDGHSGRLTGEIGKYSADATDLAFIPGRSALLIARNKPYVELWDLVSGQCRHFVSTADGSKIGVVAVPSDNDGLLAARSGAGVQVFRFSDGASIATFKVENSRGIALSPDGTRLVVTAVDSIECFDLTPARHRWSVDELTPPSTGAACFTSDGRYVVVADTNRFAFIDSVSGAVQTAMDGPRGLIHTVAYPPTGVRLATMSQDRSTTIWDRSIGKSLDRLLVGRTCSGLAFMRDAKETPRLLAADQQGTLHRYSLSNSPGHCRADATWTVGTRCYSFALSADQSLVATSELNDELKIWRLPEPAGFLPTQASLRQTIKTSRIRKLWFVDDRQVFVLHDEACTVWDALSGKKLVTLDAGKYLRAAAIRYPQREAVTVDGTHITRWDLRTGKPLLKLRPPHLTWTAEVSPDGRLLALGRSQNSIELWDLNSLSRGSAIVQTKLPYATAFAFSADNQQLAAGMSNGCTWIVHIPSLRWSRDRLPLVAKEKRSKISQALQDDRARVLLEKVAQCLARFSYRDAPPKIEAARDGFVVELPLRRAPVRLWARSYRPPLARLELELVAGELQLFDLGNSVRPNRLTRLGRWLRRRLSSKARRLATENRALLASLLGAELTAKATYERRAKASRVRLVLSQTPEPATVLRWARSLALQVEPG